MAACSSKSSSHPDGVITTTVDAPPAQCNPVAQSGCTTGQKCTWIIDQAGSAGTDDLAHIGCAADGTAALGSACTGGPGTAGTDNCVHGTACLNDHCEALCDPSATNGCGSDALNCSTYVNFYDTTSGGSDAAAGVCEPACDPLTQKEGAFGQTTGTSIACPTTSGGAQACYGVPIKGGQFSCAPAGGSAGTDGTDASTADGGPYINTCAPGNISLFDFTISGVSTAICQGFCLPSDTFTGSAAGGQVGNSTNSSGTAPYNCGRAGVLGGGSDSCIYSWSIGGDTGAFDPTTDAVSALEPWSGATSGTGLGLCWNFSVYDHFDPTNPETGTNATQAFPDCKSVGIDATVADTTCGSGAASCNTPAKVDAIFGAVNLGCVSFSTAIANPETVLQGKTRHPLDSVRFANANHAFKPSIATR